MHSRWKRFWKDYTSIVYDHDCKSCISKASRLYSANQRPDQMAGEFNTSTKD